MYHRIKDLYDLPLIEWQVTTIALIVPFLITNQQLKNFSPALTLTSNPCAMVGFLTPIEQ